MLTQSLLNPPLMPPPPGHRRSTASAASDGLPCRSNSGGRTGGRPKPGGPGGGIRANHSTPQG